MTDQPATQIPFAEQLANIAPFVAEAARHVCPPDVSADDVARLAIERFSSIGALEHGDAMFHLTSLELLGEEVAEYADAVIYRARRMAIAAARAAASLIPIARLSPDDVQRLRDAVREQYEEYANGAPIPIVQIHRPEPRCMAYAYSATGAMVCCALAPGHVGPHDPIGDGGSGYHEGNRAEALHSIEGDA